MSSNLRVNNIFPSVGTNVAIGTAGGSITLTGTVSGSSNINVGTGASISSPATNVLTLGTNNTEALRISSVGFVGIKTDNPPSELSILGAIQLLQTNASSSRLTFRGQPSSSYRWNIDNNASNNSFRIFREDDATAANGVVAVSISTTRNVSIENGNLVFSTAGTGIDFSATANSSGTMSSELLSDYEEGTWTPTIASASSNVTYTNQSGQYTKIGRLVDFAFQININTVTSVGSGDFTIGGLPFTQGTNNGRYVIQTSDLDFDSTKYSHYAYPDGSTGLKVLYTADNAGWTVASATSFPVKAGSIITARGSYIV